MKVNARMITAVFLIISLLVVPCGTAFGSYGFERIEPSAESMVGDALVARPLGLLSIALGSVFFVVSLPFSAIAGNTGQAAEKLVFEPTRFTFERPLGEF